MSHSCLDDTCDTETDVEKWVRTQWFFLINLILANSHPSGSSQPVSTRHVAPTDGIFSNLCNIGGGVTLNTRRKALSVHFCMHELTNTRYWPVSPWLFPFLRAWPILLCLVLGCGIIAIPWCQGKQFILLLLGSEEYFSLLTSFFFEMPELYLCLTDKQKKDISEKSVFIHGVFAEK